MTSQGITPELSNQASKLITTSDVSARHLRGWLSYAFASEVFAVVGLSTFLPICLEQFARDNGYLMPEKTIRCPSGFTLTPAMVNTSCVVKIGWAWIDTASFSLYVFSLSVALQALTVISMGGIADDPPHRKPTLLTFASLGSISSILFLAAPSSSPIWPFVGILACVANVGFGASVVAMNSYLPNLARETKDVRQAWENLQSYRETILQESDEDPLAFSSPSTPSSLRSDPEETYNAVLARSTSRISSQGIALGYSAGIFLLILTIIPVSLLHSSTFSLRLAIGMSGIWWAIGSIPAGFWLPSGSSLKSVEGAGATRIDDTVSWSWTREVKAAWVRLGQMLRWKEIKRLRNTFWYLAAWFLLSDGFATLASTAVLFGKTTLHMPPSRLIIIGAISPLSGIVGSLAFPTLQRCTGWSDLRIIKLLVVLVSFIPLYGCLGFLPVFRKAPGEGGTAFGGLTTEGEMYVLAVAFGFIYGSFQGYSRSFFSLLIPPGEEARWYALYSITDKSSSFIGPLVVGLISDATGNIRYGFFFLVGVMCLALPLLACVDVERGQEDAKQYIAERERGRGEYMAIPRGDA